MCVRMCPIETNENPYVNNWLKVIKMIDLGIGCKVAGFLTAFATHLSVFTLTLVTIERWYAITHAIYLNKRLKLKMASCIMVGGWLYSFVMSTLPLFGISNYSSTRYVQLNHIRLPNKGKHINLFSFILNVYSICLPMETRDTIDIIYLVSVIGMNGFGFCINAICYARMYLSLNKETRSSHTNVSRGEMCLSILPFLGWPL